MATEALTERRTRRNLRSKATRLINEIAKLDATTSSKALHQYRLKVSSLTDALAETDRVILSSIDSETSFDQEYAEADRYRDRLIEAQATLDELAKSSTTNPISTEAVNPIYVVPNPQEPIKLPKFDGTDVMEWTQFWELFDLNVHSKSIKEAEKFTRLKTLLRGAAADCLAGIPVTAANYLDAVAMLKARFGQTELLRQEHMSQLVHSPRVTSVRNVADLRRLVDHVERHTRCLRALSVPESSYEEMLYSVLCASLPKPLLLEFHRLNNSFEQPVVSPPSSSTSTAPQAQPPLSSKLSSLLAFVRREVQTRELTDQLARTNINDPPTSPTPSDKNVKRKWGKRGVKSGSSSAQALNVHVKSNDCKKCAFCSRDHELAECNSSMPIVEKKRILRNENRCFRCTGKNHSARECRSKSRLACSMCKGKHVTVMCEPDWRQRSQQAPTAASTNVTPTSETGGATLAVGAITQANSACAATPPSSRVLLNTAACFAENARGERVPVRVLFDNGSQRSFLREDVAHKLNLPVLSNEKLSITTFGEARAPATETYPKVRLWLRSRHDRQERCADVLVAKSICMGKLELPAVFAREFDFSHSPLADITDMDGSDMPAITVLIGGDLYQQFVVGPPKTLSQNLTATPLIFGWTIMGQYESNTSESDNTVICNFVETDSLNDDARRMWDLETIGIEPPMSDSQSSKFLEEFTTTNISRFPDGRYCIALPFKENVEIDTNERIARTRLQRLTTSLLRSDTLQSYNASVQEYVSNGHAERIKELDIEPVAVHYLPHRGVVKRERDTTKTRVVFDASACTPTSRCLNDNLHTGPHLNPDVVTVLLNFRAHRIAVQADIEKAFLQIAVLPKHQDYLRFLWYDSDSSGNIMLDKIAEYRMTRLIFGATCSPFILAAVIRAHLQTASSRIAEVLRRDLYVDDLITGADNSLDVMTLRQEATEILDEAKFPLRKWVTNDLALMTKWNRTYPETTREVGVTTKVLGVLWHTQQDTLSIDASHLPKLDAAIPTKRALLSVIARVFDPLGMATPFLVQAKVLFQRLWVAGVSWDQPLSGDFLANWSSFTGQLSLLDSLSMPRCRVGPNEIDCANAELHVFVDASERAYGAVIFERRVNTDGTIQTSFVISRSRVAPIKRLTIPRLEIMAALMGARLCAFVKRKVDIYKSHSEFLWTDSMDSLAWIRGNISRWKMFVANSVQEIQNISSPDRWSHCPGQENPADLLTRGISLKKLIINETWWKGPEWLLCSPSHWPQREINTVTTTNEIKNDTTVCSTVTNSETLIDFTRFSNFERLRRYIAIWLRFASCRSEACSLQRHPLNTNELNRAERCLIRLSQRQAYASLFKELEAGSSPVTFDNLRLYLDNNGCLRVMTRLKESNLPEATSQPYLISPHCHLAALLIRRAHEQTMHGSVGDTLCQVREKFFIPRARSKVKTLLHKCVICQRFNIRVPQLEFAPLPSDRVRPSAAFEVTGLDFAGPLYVYHNSDSRKVYIALFTCATSRAIHLELVDSLTVEDFLLAWRRFCARRGVPRVIWSDNARTFKRASKELYQLFRCSQHEKVRDFTTTHNIQWKFIVERAPWHGGFWERLVRSVKLSLKKTLRTALVSAEVLRTLLCEVEAILNSRPLTYSTNDPNDLQPLTPADLLIGRRLLTLPHADLFTSNEPVADQCRALWRRRQQLVYSFWRRWSKEYLVELRTATHNQAGKKNPTFHRGDLVLVKDDQISRQKWKLGRINDISVGRDGKVRSASVRVNSGSSTIVIKRPVQLLCKLELDP